MVYTYIYIERFLYFIDISLDDAVQRVKCEELWSFYEIENRVSHCGLFFFFKGSIRLLI